MRKDLKFRGKTKSYLARYLEPPTIDFLFTALSAFNRILPHVEHDGWQKRELLGEHEKASSARWSMLNGKQRRAIKVSIFVRQKDYIISTTFRRKSIEKTSAVARVLDNVEMSICKAIIQIIDAGLKDISNDLDDRFTNQLTRSFDDFVIFEHLRRSHNLDYDLGQLLEFLRDLSEQSYENSSLSFGVVIDKKKKSVRKIDSKIFPRDYMQGDRDKKYRAFTDGYKSAFLLDSSGGMEKLIDLEAESIKSIRGEHYFPEWCRNMALTSVVDKIGLSLTRQGDILFFESGSMKFTRRFGRWQYWNHAYIIEILKTISRTQKVKPNIIGKVVSFLYKYSLDISFRHTGGLFVILRNKSKVRSILRKGDALTDTVSSDVKFQFDKFLQNRTILGLDRNIILELASIDGAVVFSNEGTLLSYGAILSPQKNANVKSAEGSRSKAAIGASHYGVAIKISADGDISIYQGGKRIIQI